jgi:hypothetical protein
MIQLKMKSKRWWIGNKSYQFRIPASWSELGQLQILKVMNILMKKPIRRRSSIIDRFRKIAESGRIEFDTGAICRGFS